MNKCSPVEMRKSLEAVELYKTVGIDFVPMPVKSLEHKIELVKQADDIFNEIAYACGE